MCCRAAREYLCFSARLRAKEMLRAAVTAPPPPPHHHHHHHSLSFSLHYTRAPAGYGRCHPCTTHTNRQTPTCARMSRPRSCDAMWAAACHVTGGGRVQRAASESIFSPAPNVCRAIQSGAFCIPLPTPARPKTDLTPPWPLLPPSQGHPRRRWSWSVATCVRRARHALSSVRRGRRRRSARGEGRKRVRV